MKKEIQKLIQQAIKSAFGIDFEMGKIKVNYSPEGMGDFSTNAALLLAKEVGKSPMEVAETIELSLRGSSPKGRLNFATAAISSDTDNSGLLRYARNDTKIFEKIETASPGFVNFWLAEKYLQQVIAKISEEKNNYGSSNMGLGKKVHLDFVSANPTGPVHIGNARGGPLGDALANVFDKAGYEPYREYYVNDAGNQVAILGHSVLRDSEAQYKGEYVSELNSKLKIKNSKLLEGGNVKEIGEKAVRVILDEIIKPSMQKFGIEFNNYFSEKELQESGKVDEAIKTLKEKDLIFEKDGAIWFKSTQFGDDKDRVVVKSTGEKTYFGSDIAYHKEKIDRGFEKLVDIWGADHHGEVARTKGALEALGHEKKLSIILTQMVRVMKDSQEMKMSKRAGTYVSVDDLIDEVGKDATRFFFLMHSADTHMIFDLDLAKERSEKNPVYYVQYAHARIASILKKSEDEGADKKTKGIDTTKILEAYWGKEDINQAVKERALMFELLKFPDLIEEISQNYAVHHLPQYAIGLADKFHSFYDVCRVIDPNNLEFTARRLELVKAVQIVLAESLRLMGISAPEKM